MFNFKKHHDYLEEWQQAMATGLINGRPFSKNTIGHYRYYMGRLLAKYDHISYEMLRDELGSIPVEHFSTKRFIYGATVCFAKYLIGEKILGKSFLEKVKKLKPKRHLPPKRLTVKEADLIRLINTCKKPLDRLIVILLASTGLRATEACSLKIGDLDFEESKIIVRIGKWGKTRRVGMTDGLRNTLIQYLHKRGSVKPDDLLLVGRGGTAIDRNGLYKRLQKLGRKVGVDVTPHALRRAFVTINVAQGVPLVYLQIACGHSDITTTRSYCQTTEDEVIEAMKTKFANFS
jgi:integrase/recombinase XerD